MKEIWKQITGYENLYEVSNFGNVRSMRFNPPKNIYQSTTGYGYKTVNLYKSGKQERCSVHRLVAMMFVDGYEDGLEVNHKDLNKANNIYTNLEWVNRSYNQKHQYSLYHKDYKPNTCPVCGIEIAKSARYCMKHRNTDNVINKYPKLDELKEDLKTLSFVKIGKKYGFSDNGIRKICKQYGLPTSRSEIAEYRKNC